jgi:hypothetical protein
MEIRKVIQEIETKSLSKKEEIQRKRRWLEAFSSTRSVDAACKMTAISFNTVSKWSSEDPVFVKDFDEIKKGLLFEIESVAFDQAREGNEKQIQFLLKAWNPEKYGSQSSINLNVKKDIDVRFAGRGVEEARLDLADQFMQLIKDTPGGDDIINSMRNKALIEGEVVDHGRQNSDGVDE